MSKEPKKRFISGAICPKCSEVDRIVMYRQDDKDYRECVSCGFTDVMHFNPTQQELTTRVNETEENVKAQTQVIKILPSK